MKSYEEKKRIHPCKHSHEPNIETAKVLRETDQGKNLVMHDSLENFWEALGLNKHA